MDPYRVGETSLDPYRVWRRNSYGTTTVSYPNPVWIQTAFANQLWIHTGFASHARNVPSVTLANQGQS